MGVVFFCLLTLGCKSQKRDSERDRQDRQYFVDEFKNYFFTSCLRKGYNNKEIDLLLREDHSFNSDFLLGINNYKKIDSLSLEIYKLIKKDSLNSWQRNEGSQGKSVLRFCLCEYTSKELDSFANSQYKQRQDKLYKE